MNAQQQADRQKLDDEFRDKLLGSTCFCGAESGYPTVTVNDKRNSVQLSPCAPLKCLAHGYCVAHLTPVAAQMTDGDKAWILGRIGIDPVKGFGT